MAMISFDNSKMSICSSDASSVASLLNASAAMVSSANGALDYRIQGEVGGQLNSATDTLNNLINEANKLANFSNTTADKTSMMERAIIASTNILNNQTLAINGWAKNFSLNQNKKTSLSMVSSLLNYTGSLVSPVITGATELFQNKVNTGLGLIDSTWSLLTTGSTDKLSSWFQTTMATQMTLASSVLEPVMKFGENIIDGIRGSFAASSVAQLEYYGVLDPSDREQTLNEVAQDIGINNTQIFWDNYRNSIEAQIIESLSSLKSDSAACQIINGGTTMALYTAASLHPAGWVASAASIAGESYEHTITEGGTLNDAYTNAAPFVLLDLGLNVVGYNGFVKGVKATTASVKENVNVTAKNISEYTQALSKKVTENNEKIKTVASKAKENITDYAQGVGQRFVESSTNYYAVPPFMQKIFGKGKKATGVLDETIEKSSSLHALPTKEGYVTLTETDFENFSNELIKKLEKDSSIATTPTKEKIRETFWQNFSNLAENTYFEAGTLNYLDNLLENENMVVAIHKTGNASDDAIKNIMGEGLYVNGASMQGMSKVDNAFPGITRTATFVSNKKELAESLQSHYISPSDFSRTGTRNSIVIAYPKGLKEADVVQYINGKWSIKPEYIVGYVPAIEKEGIASVEGMVKNSKWYGVKDTEVVVKQKDKKVSSVTENIYYVSKNEPHEFFKQYDSKINGYGYGIDQGGIKNLLPDDPQYKYLKNKLVDMGFNKQEATQVLSMVDEIGACSYTDIANELVYLFRNDQELFEQHFGYPLIKNGKLNGNELLLDLFVYANDAEHINRYGRGQLFQKINGKYKIIDRNTYKQVYLSSSLSGKDEKIVNEFLANKGLKAEYKTSYIYSRSEGMLGTDDKYNRLTGEKIMPNFNGITGEKVLADIGKIHSDVIDAIESGKSVSISIHPPINLDHINLKGKKIYTKDVSTNNWNKNAGHDMFVTGINDEGLIVSSYGKEYTILWDELKFSNFQISSSELV